MCLIKCWKSVCWKTWNKKFNIKKYLKKHNKCLPTLAEDPSNILLFLFHLFFIFLFTYFVQKTSRRWVVRFIINRHLKFIHLFVKITSSLDKSLPLWTYAIFCHFPLTSCPRISSKTSEDRKLKFSGIIEDMLF